MAANGQPEKSSRGSARPILCVTCGTGIKKVRGEWVHRLRGSIHGATPPGGVR